MRRKWGSPTPHAWVCLGYLRGGFADWQAYECNNSHSTSSYYVDHETLPRELHMAQRRKAPLSVVMLDIDEASLAKAAAGLPRDRVIVHVGDTVLDGSVRAFVALGGNFVRAVPDTVRMEAAWSRLRLTVTHERLGSAAQAELWKAYWADWLAGRIADGRQVFAYFNNDWYGHAVTDATWLRRRLA